MKKVFLIAVTLFCLAGSVQSIGLIGIDISRKNIELEQNFKFEVSIKYPEANHQLYFFVDDHLFSQKMIGSTTEEVDSTEWNWDVVDLNCGEHTALAELRRGNVSVENISMNFDIGNLPAVSFDPKQPLAGRTIDIILTNAVSGAPASGLKVEIYDIQGGVKEKRSTDAFGKISYRPDNSGEYRMEFSGRDYCGKRSFYARKKLMIDGPHPENPVVGELISIALPADVGVKLFDENGDVYLLAETKIGGGANFTVNKSGTYTLVMGDLSSRYWGINKTLVVSDKDVPKVLINPEKVVIGEPVTIKVESGGFPLDSAVITITAPDNSFDAFTTISSGMLVYTPSVIGKYTVSVEKERFEVIDKNFESKKKLDIDLTPRNPSVGEEVIISIKDQEGNPVGDATLTIDGRAESTDASGLYVTTFKEARVYVVEASKTSFLYWDTEENITVTGTLNISLNPESAEVGQQTKIIVYDGTGNPISTNLTVTKPDGNQECLMENVYYPDQPGDHTIEALKEGYTTAKKTLFVSPNEINMHYEVDNNRLKMFLSSQGNPVPDIHVKLSSPYETEGVSDSDGAIYFSIKAGGEYVFDVNKEKTRQEYEKKSVTEKIVKRRKTTLLVIPIIIVIILAAAALTVLYRVKHYRKGKKGKTSKTKSDSKLLEKSPKSSLSKL